MHGHVQVVSDPGSSCLALITYIQAKGFLSTGTFLVIVCSIFQLRGVHLLSVKKMPNAPYFSKLS